MSEALVYKNGFMKKNILSFFLIAVLANIFLGCQKEFTTVDEVRIVRTEITEIGTTTAVFTIVSEGNDWWLDGFSVGMSYYPIGDNNDIRFTWDRGYDFENNILITKRIVYIEGLEPGNHYRVYATIRKDNIIVYSDSQYFTTEMEL